MKKVILLLGLVLMSCSKEGGGSDGQDKLKFTLTVSAGEGGSVDTAGGTYPEGTSVTVTATPDSEYTFDKWSGTESSTNNPLNIVITSNENVTANFIKKQYELAITIEGEGDVEEVVTQQGKQYASGSQVELTAVAAEGWQFSGWSGDIDSTDNPILVTLDKAKELTASFIRKTYELTVTISGEGIVTEEVITIPSQYEFETELRLVAEPSQYWEFIAWSGDIESIDNPMMLTIDKKYNIHATFEFIDSDGDGVTDEIDQCENSNLNETINQFGCVTEDIYVAENGKTVKCENANIGDTKFINGKLYTVVGTRGQLLNLAQDGDDNTCPCSSKISNMDDLIGDIYLEDISTWDVSNVTSMARMFVRTNDFHQDLSFWDTSNVTNMSEMFFNVQGFSADISTWDTSNVKDMNKMFAGASDAYIDVSNWNTSNVENMNAMFEGFVNFNQNLNWNTSNVSDMASMFNGAVLFDGDISNWDTSNVTSMQRMFYKATAFNKNISNWNTSNVNTMSEMFFEADKFNQDISHWDTSNVTSMYQMFYNLSFFNQDLSLWNVDNVMDCRNFNNLTFTHTLPEPNFTNCNPN